ncbi:GNAT family N-acetyltransferase [Nitratireductor soli]|uniref:GNAT family N-acetyltransferase n=1 Tax=Nitratireductor soli TaxID=1670619 RepID=UPI00065E10D0|nr:GNAT family N-acetyltransferase [Nitratireductor soli]
MREAGPYFVRTAARGDLPAVRALLIETWHDTYDSLYGAARVAEITDAWHSIAALETRLAKPNCEFVVADSGEEIGGMAFAEALDAGKTVMLHQLYVRPQRQGRGIGVALLDEMEACFPDACQIRLEVEEANGKALAFYDAHGFAQIGRTENCGEGGSGIPALIYEKPL